MSMMVQRQRTIGSSVISGLPGVRETNSLYESLYQQMNVATHSEEA